VILRTILPTFSAEGPRYLQLVAYGLILVFGILHLLRHLRRHRHDEKVDPGHDDGDLRSPSTGVQTAPSWLLALSVGLVPCPVSTILLVYGIANGVLPFMILMVVGVSVGGFLTMSGISLAVIAGRERLLARPQGGLARAMAATLEYAASSVIIVFGGVLFLSLL
jgi:ABC-type nickel/cobalt efflux system permease component RcnA